MKNMFSPPHYCLVLFWACQTAGVWESVCHAAGSLHYACVCFSGVHDLRKLEHSYVGLAKHSLLDLSQLWVKKEKKKTEGA